MRRFVIGLAFLTAVAVSATAAPAAAQSTKAAAEKKADAEAKKDPAKKDAAKKDAGGKKKASEKKASTKGEEKKPARAGTSSDEGDDDEFPGVVKTEEGDEKGVKVYTFGATEVEGRLKSPQITYFLRRVRAEFAAGDLGHRSFLRELSDTRRSPALR